MGINWRASGIKMFVSSKVLVQFLTAFMMKQSNSICLKRLR